jgi:uncharacterized protein YjiS (DUF1127 family)
MQSTTHDIDQVTIAAAVEVSSLASRLRAAMLATMARWRTRRVVQDMSDAQLRDIGIDRTEILGNRPVIKVDARLATHLASLR